MSFPLAYYREMDFLLEQCHSTVVDDIVGLTGDDIVEASVAKDVTPDEFREDDQGSGLIRPKWCQ